MTDADAPLLEARGITRFFGRFAANRDVSLAIRPGERHALLGENGAGKSTLVKMIYGVLAPSGGEFLWEGQPVAITSPAAARALGIGMVFQHFNLFDALTVAENIALSLRGERMRGLAARITKVSRSYGLAIDPNRAVHSLSAGEKQRVEIIRCLLQNPRLLIMDEPTSVLTPQEAEVLFATLRRLSGEGCAILYISHKLDEVRALCDAATVLRAGEVVAQCDPRSASSAEIAALMVGRDVAQVGRTAAGGEGPVRLSVRNLSLPAPSQFGTALHDVSLDVRGGELVGIAGVAGEGQSELMQALIGERRTPRPETVSVDGRGVGHLGPDPRRLAGAAFVPEERAGHAAVPDMGLPDNVLLSHHRVERLIGPAGWIRRARTSDWAARVREAFDVRAGGARPRAGALSGGNLQKFVVGREILRDPGVLIVNQPTWGVDPGAAVVIRQALVDLARRGAAVLVISQDLEELFAIADRIAVIHAGRLSAARPVSELDAETVGLLMGGAEPGADRDDRLNAETVHA
ncbi:ABC transporter ATP-binding protein [Limibaculum sp. M0105]|uniref:ABC transporter ATP-binding protein n=1 Tax=Thermohalobaculum xanthum TaxID=2753746 RepID=A0A8J7M641_9RHOB|nr:ABC transporter ATP-binding protein [Thermohalobaculum xanthum]MBK0398890.1 ABC transporter ATP-binding protein [Thermohalobaculum xanthum]